MTRLLHAFVACVVVLGCAGDSSAQDAEDVVARVGGAEVTLQEVEDAWHDNDAASRIRMLQQLYDTRRRVLDIVIGDRLIDREAQTRGVSRDELLSAELPGRITPVADAEVDVAVLQTTMQSAIRQHLNPLFKISDVVLIDKLPRTASNKVMRRVLRQQYMDRAGA